MLIDSHCHLDFNDFEEDFEDIIILFPVIEYSVDDFMVDAICSIEAAVSCKLAD